LERNRSSTVPRSRSRTLTEGFSLSRLAKTHPAVPPANQKVRNGRVTSDDNVIVDGFIFLFGIFWYTDFLNARSTVGRKEAPYSIYDCQQPSKHLRCCGRSGSNWSLISAFPECASKSRGFQKYPGNQISETYSLLPRPNQHRNPAEPGYRLL